MNFRKATILDLELLQHWDRQPHVIACDPEGDWDWKNVLQIDPPWREYFISEIENEPIGMLQIIDPYLEDSRYWGDVGPNKRAIDIWVGEAYNLNKGYGTEMMKWAINRCFSDPTVNEILIDPLKTNTKAHRFYERLGFQFLEERDFDGDRCLVYYFTREHFKNIDSSESI